MVRTNAGAGWLGWVVAVGLPVTMGLLFINWPLAVVAAGLTFAAWKLGAIKKPEQSAERGLPR